MKSVDQLLAEHPFTSDLSVDQITLMARTASVEEFEEDDFIFHEHEEARWFYLIISGNVALKISAPGSGPIPIQTIAAGQALGWSWMMPPYKWHFGARAITRVTALRMDAGYLRRTMEENAELGYAVLYRMNRVLAERLQATRLQLLDVYQCAV